jgi:hypothetical protein
MEELFTTGWVHVFEEDTAEGAVYRPENSDIPLSRRPRERLKLEPDGTAVLYTSGPDDRYVEQSATWRDEGGAVVVRARGGRSALRIVDRSPTRLLVKTEGTRKKSSKR